MTRLEQLQALYEECGDAESRGRLECAAGKDITDNPHWLARESERYQPDEALAWKAGWEAEHAFAAAGEAQHTPTTQHLENAA